jgi:hypothetical protein
MKSELVGFVRMSRTGNAVKVSISKEAFDNARSYLSQNGEEFVPLVITLGHLESLIAGEKEVTSISQMDQ